MSRELMVWERAPERMILATRDGETVFHRGPLTAAALVDILRQLGFDVIHQVVEKQVRDELELAGLRAPVSS